MYYSSINKKVYLPKAVFKRVNAFLDFAFFFSLPDGYYVTFTPPSIELLSNSADHAVQDLIVGRNTLFVMFKKDYFPSETKYITWQLMHYKSKTYKLRIYNKDKQQLKFIEKEKPPWLK